MGRPSGAHVLGQAFASAAAAARRYRQLADQYRALARRDPEFQSTADYYDELYAEAIGMETVTLVRPRAIAPPSPPPTELAPLSFMQPSLAPPPPPMGPPVPTFDPRSRVWPTPTLGPAAPPTRPLPPMGPPVPTFDPGWQIRPTPTLPPRVPYTQILPGQPVATRGAGIPRPGLPFDVFGMALQAPTGITAPASQFAPPSAMPVATLW
jgi:hypothetical protein